MTASTPEKQPSISEDPPIKVHRGWVFWLAIAGVAITYAAFWGPFLSNVLGENAVAVWQSILTNFGVGLFSAAVLLALEPRFRRAVRQTVRTATKNLKTEVLSAVESDIEERLAPLAERIDALYESRLAGQAAVIDDLSQHFTHERAYETLQKASAVSALWHDSIIVQAVDEPGKLHVGIEIKVPDDELRRVGGGTYMQSHYIAQAPLESKKLHVRARTDFHQSVEVVWNADEDFPSVALKLADKLAEERHRGLHEKIDWDPIFSRLERAIKVAVDSSNKAPNALLLQGPLVEMAGPDTAPWYLTHEGLHYPSKDWFRGREAIGGWAVFPQSYEPQIKVERPDWADPKEWEYVLRQARDHFDSW